jgi:hypothetical protein
MALRTNYLSRYTPDAYNVSMGGGMVPVDTINTPKIDTTGMQANIDALNLQAKTARDSTVGETKSEAIDRKEAAMNDAWTQSLGGLGINIGSVGDLEKARKAKGATTTTSGSGGTSELNTSRYGEGAAEAAADASGAADSVSGGSTGGGKGAVAAQAGVAAAAVIAPVVSTHYENKGKEDTAGALTGMASGAAAGAALGPWGALGGAVVGGIAGGIKGRKQMKARKKREKEEDEWNTKMNKLRSSSLTQSDDLNNYLNVLSAAKGGVIRFKSGGLLRYGTIDVADAKKYVSGLIAKYEKENGKLKNYPIYKAGGKIPKHQQSSVIKMPDPGFPTKEELAPFADLLKGKKLTQEEFDNLSQEQKEQYQKLSNSNYMIGADTPTKAELDAITKQRDLGTYNEYMQMPDDAIGPGGQGTMGEFKMLLESDFEKAEEWIQWAMKKNSGKNQPLPKNKAGGKVGCGCSGTITKHKAGKKVGCGCGGGKMHKSGGDSNTIIMVSKVPKKVFKKKKVEKKAEGGSVRIFKRGGKADINKLNVIVDGPSHSDENNTGIKGDKGLPVVFNGKKVAEIESHELVINSTSSKELEELVKKAKAGDKKAKIELADKLSKELANNTYDYSELLD